MKSLGKYEIWFLTGSQDRYGEDTLRQVADHAALVAAGLDDPVRIVFKAVVKWPEEIKAACVAASADEDCVGVIAWMHTFSPAKMWIAGLQALRKPLLHLHTQFNPDLPRGEIDGDFMNLNQGALAAMAAATLALDLAAEPVDQFRLDRHDHRKHGLGAYYRQPGDHAATRGPV